MDKHMNYTDAAIAAARMIAAHQFKPNLYTIARCVAASMVQGDGKKTIAKRAELQRAIETALAVEKMAAGA